jgi:hypothetical protein
MDALIEGYEKGLMKAWHLNFKLPRLETAVRDLWRQKARQTVRVEQQLQPGGMLIRFGRL